VAKSAPADEVKVLARNKRARHEYHVDETLEAGLVLAGSEVKSIRDGKVTLVDAFADIDKGEAWLHQMDVGVYTFSHGRNHEPRRKRKLLLHRREIDRMYAQVREKGMTIVPTRLYFKDGRVKTELALVKSRIAMPPVGKMSEVELYDNVVARIEFGNPRSLFAIVERIRKIAKSIQSCSGKN
jgi:SsrA-binding protein